MLLPSQGSRSRESRLIASLQQLPRIASYLVVSRRSGPIQANPSAPEPEICDARYVSSGECEVSCVGIYFFETVVCHIAPLPGPKFVINHGTLRDPVVRSKWKTIFSSHVSKLRSISPATSLIY